MSNRARMTAYSTAMSERQTRIHIGMNITCSWTVVMINNARAHHRPCPLEMTVKPQRDEDKLQHVDGEEQLELKRSFEEIVS